ncbi:hypothetical protein [Salibacter halophilus]|uniref:Uncharacterized protein n=1 Tax=Salibacter halophilus TaxID=1803916 RepID=A0A6N6MC27_9FLAO|nr:hypothetical protein [Salibacter halophilus]KAB1064874.1 hypothetical protein F3059_05830 [Salibacter halophilus]
MKSLLVALISFIPILSLAQEKIEREKRIKSNEVPSKAIEWMDDAYEDLENQIKWYFEETSGSYSYEAKVKFMDDLHSVEFDTLGNIQDIEIIKEWDELLPGVKENLQNYFQSNFKKFKIRKIQIQYTGDEDDLEDLIDENEFEDLTIRYEIKFYGKTEQDKKIWEALFDDEGKYIQKREVILNTSNNLNF